jgi:hypothetical protein
MAIINPYATALALGRPKPSHVADGPWNVDRITAYGTYEDIWNNLPEALAALLRTSDDPKSRRYVPVVRGLIEGVNRYLAKDPEIAWTAITGATVDQAALDEFAGRVQATLTREEFDIKFLALKRWWLVKGDSLLMLSADPSKDEGTRMRITEVPADQYFPIEDPADSERIMGVYLASIVQNDADEDIVQRIEFQKASTQDRADAFGVPLGSIFYRIGYFEQDGWDDRDGDDLSPTDPPSWVAAPADAAADPMTGFALPAQITTIPVYHFRNNRRGGPMGRFGISEIQGLESILAGAIQNATDEDMAIALLGIGVYWTDSGRPHLGGKEVDWEIAPGTMLEVEKDGKVGKLEGVSSVTPIQDHLNYIVKSAREASSIPDIAAGTVDPNNPASGVALAIQFLPILAHNLEKESELSSKLTQMLYDLAYMWFPAYEGWTPLQVQPSVQFASPIPVDRAATLKEILDMVTARVISIEFAQSVIASKLGYTFPADMLAKIVTEQQTLLDATGARLATEDPNADGSFGAGADAGAGQ